MLESVSEFESQSESRWGFYAVREFRQLPFWVELSKLTLWLRLLATMGQLIGALSRHGYHHLPTPSHCNALQIENPTEKKDKLNKKYSKKLFLISPPSS